MTYKDLVLEMQPLARCNRFPMILPTPLTVTWRVRLTPSGEIFSKGNTAGQAWRRAYEKILQQRRVAAELATPFCSTCDATDWTNHAEDCANVLAVRRNALQPVEKEGE